MWRYAWIGVCLAASGATAAADSSEFGARRFPLAPVLVQNQTPALCTPFLDRTVEAFKSAEPLPRIGGAKIDGVQWVDWPAESMRRVGNGDVAQIDIDLDGTGHQQTVLFWTYEHSWRGYHSYAYVVPREEALTGWLSDGGDLSSVLQYRSSGRRETEPPIPLIEIFPKEFGSEWEPVEMFRWRKGLYLLYQSSLPWGDDPFRIAIHRVAADGTLEPHCRIDVPDREDKIAATLKISSVAALGAHLSWIGGQGLGGCGTLNADVRHVQWASAATRTTAIRPWAVSLHAPEVGEGYHLYNERMLAFLEEWSRESPWNRVVLLELRSHVAHAEELYSEILAREFRVPRELARARARTVIENLIAAWILVPSGFQPPEDYYSFERHALTLALSNRDLAGLTAALGKRAELLAPKLEWYPQPRPPVSRLSASLHDGVLWLQGLEAVLKAGADVDAPNPFSKTPLMAAAHMNRPDTVRELLRHEAKVNARTDDMAECGYWIARGSRTALMYAAENAGPETIRLLLDAGADTSVRDSEGNGVEFYLALNPRFAPGTSIAAAGNAAPVSDAPSFQCSSRLGPVEAAICSDEILRMYDREIAAAYRKLLKRDGKTIRTEQRTWLTERNSCARERETVGCLQDALLARSRNLHRRLLAAP